MAILTWILAVILTKVSCQSLEDLEVVHPLTKAHIGVGNLVRTSGQFKDRLGSPLQNKYKRHATKGHRWAGGEIPYEFVTTDGDRNIVLGAMRLWERSTCIKFRPATPNDKNKLRIRNGVGCNTAVGQYPFSLAQNLTLQFPGCWNKRTALHELGHTIGLHHEQQHPEASKFFKVNKNNIDPNCHTQWEFMDASKVDTYGIPYDPKSIMHYSSYGCSLNYGHKESITFFDKSLQWMPAAGNDLSPDSDIKIVNLMYNCQGHVTGETPDKRNVPEFIEGCKDEFDSCPFLANRGDCVSREGYMSYQCQKSCNRCPGGNGNTGTNTTPPRGKTLVPGTGTGTGTGGNCQDNPIAKCKEYPDFYCKSENVKFCLNTCGKCDTTKPGTGTNTGTCVDNPSASCAQFPDFYCNNPNNVKFCMKTCGRCGSGTNTGTTDNGSGTCLDNPIAKCKEFPDFYCKDTSNVKFCQKTCGRC